MRIIRPLAAAALGCAVVASCVAGAGTAAAKGADGPVAGTGSSVACGQVSVLDPALVARNPASPPAAKFSVTNCGAGPLAATVRVTEEGLDLWRACPVPASSLGSVPIALDAGRKTTSSVGSSRGPCGYRGSQSGEIIQGVYAWQNRYFRLSLVDDATGAVLSSDSFSVFDAPSKV